MPKTQLSQNIRSARQLLNESAPSAVAEEWVAADSWRDERACIQECLASVCSVEFSPQQRGVLHFFWGKRDAHTHSSEDKNERLMAPWKSSGRCSFQSRLAVTDETVLSVTDKGRERQAQAASFAWCKGARPAAPLSRIAKSPFVKYELACWRQI